MREDVTMNCQEVQKFVHVYVDGEFGDDERREFELHLQQCGDCRAVVRFEERFKAAVQSRIPKLKAPERLLHAVREDLDKEPEPATSAGAWRYVAIPAAAMAAAALLVFILWPTGQTPESDALEVGVAHHERTLPMEVQGPDEQAVAQWYRDKVAVPVRPPVFRSQGVSLTGGRLVDFNRVPAAYLVYRNGNRKKVSVHIFDPKRLPRGGLVRRRVAGKIVYFGKVNGHNVAVFKYRGVGYAITADVSRVDLQRMVRTVLYRR